MIVWLLPGLLSSLPASAATPPLSEPSVLLSRPIPNDSGRSDVGAGVLPIEGGALIAGWTSEKDAPPDGLLLRVDADGDVVWRRQFGGQGTDLLWSILPDPAGGYACVGFTGSQGKGNLDGWLLHFDAQGKLDWERTYGGAGEDRLSSIQPIREGWIAVGQTSSAGARGIDAWVLRLDRRGRELGSWMVEESEVDRAFGIQPLPDGGCIIAGMTGKDLAKPESFDAFLARLAPDGKRVWFRRDRRPGLQVYHDVRAYRDGTFLVVGYGYLNRKEGIDAIAARFSPAGAILWEKTFGGPTYDRANHAQILPDDTAVIVGYSQRPGAADEETGWDLLGYRLSPRGVEMSLNRFGGEGFEFGRGVAGDLHDVWMVGHTSTGRSGSSVLVIRLDFGGSG
jgi:hypothetical protein